MSENNKKGASKSKLGVVVAVLLGFAVVAGVIIFFNPAGQAPSVSPESSDADHTVSGPASGKAGATAGKTAAGPDYSVLQAAIDSAYGKDGNQPDGRVGQWELFRLSLDMFLKMGGGDVKTITADSQIDDREMVFNALGVDRSEFSRKQGTVKDLYTYGDPVELELCFASLPVGVKFYSVTFYGDGLSICGLNTSNTIRQMREVIGSMAVAKASMSKNAPRRVEQCVLFVDCGIEAILEDGYQGDSLDAKPVGLRIYDKWTALPKDLPDGL